MNQEKSLQDKQTLEVLLEVGLMNEASLKGEQNTRLVDGAGGQEDGLRGDDEKMQDAKEEAKDCKRTLEVLHQVGLINDGSHTSGTTREKERVVGEAGANRLVNHHLKEAGGGAENGSDKTSDELGETASTIATTHLDREESLDVANLTSPRSDDVGGGAGNASANTPGAFSVSMGSVQLLEPMRSSRSLTLQIDEESQTEEVHPFDDDSEGSEDRQQDVVLDDAFLVVEEGVDCQGQPVGSQTLMESFSQFSTLDDGLEVVDGKLLVTKTPPQSKQCSQAAKVLLLVLFAIVAASVTLLAIFFRPAIDDEEGDAAMDMPVRDDEGPKENPWLVVHPPFVADTETVPAPIAKAIQSIGSPQHSANLWMLEDPYLHTYSLQRQWQRFHMVSFFYMSNGQHWFRNDHWLSYNVSECEWYNQGSGAGVYGLESLDALPVCNQDNELLVFNVSANNLSGLFELITHWVPTMRRLDISKNNLEGLIPVMSHQPDVEVYDVSENNFDGLMVGEFSSFKMKVTRTHGNKLFGHAPGIYQFLKDLEHLDNSGNLYQNPLVTEIGHCHDLKSLNNANNMFYGSLPSELGSLSMLRSYNVSGNIAVNGTIPSEYGMLTKLTSLDLSGTSVTGKIPEPLCERFYAGSLEIAANCSLLQCCNE